MMRQKIGIAIATYNRCENLIKQIDLIKRLSALDITIVVCDDGSSDGTAEALAERGILRIGDVNRGIAWNKNRGIFYLFNYTDVDAVILMDDDVMPDIYGWDLEWLKAAMMYGYVNYVPPSLESHVFGGRMTADNVAISELVGGMTMAISREAFSRVGYMDVRFGHSGSEHDDYSSRFVRAGYGGLKAVSGGIYFYVIKGGVYLADLPSTRTAEEADQNRDLLFKLAEEPVYRAPWIDDEGYASFLSEFDQFSAKITPEIAQISCDFDEQLYLDANPDVRNSNMRGLHHYIVFGRFENRRTKPE